MNIISVLHFIFVVYVLIVPFVSSSLPIMGLHAAILTSLLLHWYLNNDICVLTLLEQFLFPNPNNNKDELFFQKLIGPIYNIDNVQLNVCTILLLFFTVHQFLKYSE